MMATNLPEALDEALLRPGRIDRIYKVGYPSKAGRVRTYEGYFAKVRARADRRADRQAGDDHPVRDRRHHQGPGQRVADRGHPQRPGRHHLAGRDQGQAAQGARPARGRRVHRAGTARGRRARGVPRRRRLPDPPAPGDRHRHDREGQRLPRHGGQSSRPRTSSPGGAASTRPTSWCPWRRWPASGCSSTATAPPACPATWSRRPPWPRSWRASGAWARRCPPTRPPSAWRSARPAAGRVAGTRRARTRRPELRRALADRIEDTLGTLLRRVETFLSEDRAKVLSLATRWRRTRR